MSDWNKQDQEHIGFSLLNYNKKSLRKPTDRPSNLQATSKLQLALVIIGALSLVFTLFSGSLNWLIIPSLQADDVNTKKVVKTQPMTTSHPSHIELRAEGPQSTAIKGSGNFVSNHSN